MTEKKNRVNETHIDDISPRAYAKHGGPWAVFMLKNTGITSIRFLDMKYIFNYSCQQQEYPVYSSWRDSTLLTKIILDTQDRSIRE